VLINLERHDTNKKEKEGVNNKAVSNITLDKFLNISIPECHTIPCSILKFEAGRAPLLYLEGAGDFRENPKTGSPYF
jgi:hypothetical protein